MGGCQRDMRIYERYSSATMDVASCVRSDRMAMVVSDGGDGLFRWSSGPDHIKPTLGPWCGENGEVSRGRAARRCASARDAEIRITLFYPVKQCNTHVSNRLTTAAGGRVRASPAQRCLRRGLLGRSTYSSLSYPLSTPSLYLLGQLPDRAAGAL